MQSTYGGRPGLAPARPPSYEIKVTREVSVDSRPESRKRMHYTTFPPNAAVKPKSYNAITHARASAESSNPKAFADFSFSNSNDVDTIQNTLTGSGLRQRNSTLDLAQFLRTTSPPQSREPSPMPTVAPSRTTSMAKKLAMGLFKGSGSRSGSNSNRNTPTPERERPMIRLPDSVVSRTSRNGAKYLLISVPTTTLEATVEEPVVVSAAPMELDPAYSLTVPQPYSHQQQQQTHVELPANPPSIGEILNRPYRSGTMETEGSAISAFRPFGAAKEPARDVLAPMTQPPARSMQPSPALDEDVATTYHSYLKSQGSNVLPKKENMARDTPSREGPATRPTTANSIRTDGKGHSSRFSMGSVLISDEDGGAAQGKHSRALSAISDAPSYKSVSIHHDGVPSRTSSSKPAVQVADAHRPGTNSSSVVQASIASTLNAPPAQTSRPSSAQDQMQSHAQIASTNRLPLPIPSVDNRHSHASTAGSTAESIGASSDASSGVVMDAQVARSAGNVGYYNSNARKPPRPGPAPTRALPSLPENKGDDNGMLRHRRSQGAMRPEIVHSTLTVPERLTIIESPIVTEFVEATSKPMFDPPSRTNTMESTGSKPVSERRQRSMDRDTLTPSPKPVAQDAMSAARRSRQERVRARKMRDLQSIRARHENAKLDESLSPQQAQPQQLQHQQSPRSDRDTRVRSSLASEFSHASSAMTTDSSSAGSSGSSTGRSSFRLSGTGSAASPNHRLSATGSVPAPLRRISRNRRLAKNAASPIMLVMEQEPASGLFYASSNGMTPVVSSQQALLRKKRSTSLAGASVHTNGTPTPPRSPSPSLPSSDEDTLKRNSSKKTVNTHTPTTSISASAGGRSSMQSLAKGKEAEIDARFVAMERKNAVLEAALMAVLQTTAGFGQSSSSGSRLSGGSSQARWSGSSSIQQQPAPSPLETLMQSMAASAAAQRE